MLLLYDAKRKENALKVLEASEFTPKLQIPVVFSF